MNPEFSGAYLAIVDGDLSTAKMFDGRREMSQWIVDQLEVQGAEKVETTVINGDGIVDPRLTTGTAVYTLDEENCYKFGPVEPALSQHIRVSYDKSFSLV